MKRALVVLLLSMLAAPAAAQDAAEARRRFEQGVAAMDQGRPDLAADHFAQSYRLYPRASTACNMALAQEQLGRPCDAARWYRQCAAIDVEGEVRDHANRQAAALDARCAPAPVQDPFVRERPAASADRSSPPPVQVIEAPTALPLPSAGPDHTLLGVGIAGLVLGLGGIGGGIGAALEAQSAAAQLPAGGGALAPGSPEARALERAGLFSDVALGLYIGGGILAAIGLIAVIVDLAQPGVFGPRAARGGPRLAVFAGPEGAVGALTLGFW